MTAYHRPASILLIARGTVLALLAVAPSGFGVLNAINELFGAAPVSSPEAIRVAQFGHGTGGSATGGWGLCFSLLCDDERGAEPNEVLDREVDEVLESCVVPDQFRHRGVRHGPEAPFFRANRHMPS